MNNNNKDKKDNLEKISKMGGDAPPPLLIPLKFMGKDSPGVGSAL